MSLLRYAFLMMLVWGGAHASKQDYYHTFWNPGFHGQRLDYCMGADKACGLPVAKQYCQRMGYDDATQHMIDYNVGKTQAFLNRKPCKGWQCNGFTLIKCKAKFTHQPISSYYYRQQEFVFPRFNHERVDWCYEDEKGCGKKAATSFCRRMGYLRAKHYKIQPHVSQTRAIGNHKVCVGNHCNAFSRIVCYR